MGFMRPEFLVILVVVLLIFGPKKLPEMGSAIGKSITQFRKGMNETHASEAPQEIDERQQKSAELEAIEREIVARKAAAAAYEANQQKVD